MCINLNMDQHPCGLSMTLLNNLNHQYIYAGTVKLAISSAIYMADSIHDKTDYLQTVLHMIQYCSSVIGKVEARQN